MACHGSKVIRSRRSKTGNFEEMSSEENPSNHGGRKMGKNRKPTKEIHCTDGQHPTEISYGGSACQTVKVQKASKHTKSPPVSQKTVLRKMVDPETARYFSEISSHLEDSTIDPGERSVLCGNALEESRGKELELLSDKITSWTMEALLKGCELGQLCSFLLSCAKDFPHIAIDQSGSRVAETALRSLAVFLQDKDANLATEHILTKICKELASNSVNVMQSRYGSHVLRSLLCLLKGTPIDSWETFHTTKSATVLAERLNSSSLQSSGGQSSHTLQGFPELLKFFFREILTYTREDLTTLRLNNDSSLVLQTALKLLAGDDPELLHTIPILLGCHEESISQGFLETTAVETILDLLKDSAFSHLMEVILVVAPEALYFEILTKVFKGSLFKISSDPFGNFVVQALISSARRQNQMNLIWEELGPKFKELLKMRKSGVIASLLAACQRLHTHEHESCRALIAAICSEPGSPGCLVPRILVLESYFYSEQRKLSVLGCLMLQTIFKYSSDLIQPYISSFILMEADHILEAAKDAGGSRVLETFLSSDASAKQKRKVISKLQGHFAELSMHPSGSYTVEKCFNAGNVPLKEIIVSELSSMQAELSRTNHGPHLLKKLDVARFSRKPEEWRSAQASKHAAYEEFSSLFSSKTHSRKGHSDSSALGLLSQKDRKKKRKLPDTAQSLEFLGSDFKGLEKSMAKMGLLGFKRPKILKDGRKEFFSKTTDQNTGKPGTGDSKNPHKSVIKNNKRKFRTEGDGSSTPFLKNKKHNW